MVCAARPEQRLKSATRRRLVCYTTPYTFSIILMNENHFGSLIADSRCVETEILLLPPNMCASYRILLRVQ